MAFGLDKVKKKNLAANSKKVDEIKSNKVSVSFTVPNSFMKKLNKEAKKGTKTKVLEIKLEKIYDAETKEFIYDTDSKNKDHKVTLNTRLDPDMAKAFKKLAKKKNKTTGDLLMEIFKYIEDSES